MSLQSVLQTVQRYAAEVLRFYKVVTNPRGEPVLVLGVVTSVVTLFAAGNFSPLAILQALTPLFASVLARPLVTPVKT
jgi:hypothetical protein